MFNLDRKFFVVILWSIFFGQYSFSQTLIKGYIKDSNLNNIMYYEPINGFFNSKFPLPNSQIFPDFNGNFEKRVSINSPIIVSIQIGIQTEILFIEPSD